MFSAIAYQLQSIGICGIDASKLREMVANHLENNASHYCPFVSQLQTPRDDYTMPPTDEDAYIDTIADPELQSLLRWQQYLIKLRNGAWGDNIAIQGIANLFSVRINVLSSQYATFTPIEPADNSAQHELFVGLISMLALTNQAPRLIAV